MKKHILLCGARGVGKSTLIQSLMKEADLPVYGFVTKRLSSDASGFHPIYIHPAAQPEEARLYTGENCIGSCSGKERVVYRNVFDRVGSALIRQASEDGLLIMDELGFMESEAEEFQQAVLKALDGDIPVIAAVKNRQDVPFIRKICRHPKADIYIITEDNRDALREELIPVVRAWCKFCPEARCLPGIKKIADYGVI